MKKLNTFLIQQKLIFGDYILFQEYKPPTGGGNQLCLIERPFLVSKPILAIYLGVFPCDQTAGFNYVEWINEYRIINPEIKQHIEWYDYTDILGHWKHKPNFKEVLVAYRKQNTKQIMSADDIDWSYEK